MGIGAVGSATYFPTAWTGVPRSDYQAVPPTSEISGSSAAAAVPIRHNLSSNTSSSSGDSDSDEDLDQGGRPSSYQTSTRKRKRGGTGDGSTSCRRMMYLFQGLMNQVVEKQEAMQHLMEKQEAMQQRFLETFEKREQERMIREDAWRRQEMARLIRENEMMALDREISASRHATVIAFLQKITGQVVQPSPIIIPAAPPPALVEAPPLQPQYIQPPAAPAPPPQPKQHQYHQTVQQLQPPQSSEVIVTHHHQPTSTDHVTIAVPEQQHSPALEMGSGGFDPALSGWQQTEVLELIKLKSLIDSRYREAGLRGGPLWGEISAEMGRMGYNRSAKQCQLKLKTMKMCFKRAKENPKKRPEDAKTCPYFHQLDALHQKKVRGDQTYQESPTDQNQSSNTYSSSVDPNQY